ncbi:cation:proton antiporter domain-containing protein [Siphonobacter aquaeclarae]|jgi:Kef-type K+ transport system membrane component KefB|uniref:Sodium/proton antiporter, CPA1 family n=1 Tax=Siphonobacter aquaeclarae TaxID=563176 RepID=A0A1G9PJP7_9BACT|nr:cation:proton antiporter [Siphonobacter aquaeclarae]SDL98345.1 sodium/proton antiporter, CPA1 family [Siphonobacter aquaeclarae]
MNTNWILIVSSSLILVSYLFNFITKKTNIPSVLLLLGLGVGLRIFADSRGFHLSAVSSALPALGTVGLILIVLEGALELELDRKKSKIISQSLAAALGILVATAFTMATPLAIAFGDFHRGLLNAVPLAVISSAVAIPSVAHLTDPAKREFITYESSFSDILGVMLFNFVLANDNLTAGSVGAFFGEIVLILVMCLVGCCVLVYLMSRITQHVKFFLIIALLILVYSLAKLFHLSPLLLILAFGLMMNNIDLVIPKFLRKYLEHEKLDEELPVFKSITAESAFLIRTYFFVLFGFSIDIASLVNMKVWLIGGIMVLCLYTMRAMYLKWVLNLPLVPELFIAPRGLITVLLYFGIPSTMVLPGFSGVLLFTVIVTNLVMTGGLIYYARQTGQRIDQPELSDTSDLPLGH